MEFFLNGDVDFRWDDGDVESLQFVSSPQGSVLFLPSMLLFMIDPDPSMLSYLGIMTNLLSHHTLRMRVWSRERGSLSDRFDLTSANDQIRALSFACVAAASPP